mgnify:CR=1 FL=1|tara:strand:- start:1645 stop:2220 length:576 start_codon:yes stop_codon:yes gene_type:complete
MQAVVTEINVDDLYDPDYISDTYVRELDRMTSGIYESDKRGRSKEEIVLTTLRGLASEVAFTRKFPQFCRHNQPPFAFDVANLTGTKGTRIEIKCPKKDKDWWVPVHYDHFYTNAHKKNVDYICNTYLDNKNRFYIKAIANAYSFERYVKQGPYNEYYNHHAAIKDGECWIGSNAVNKIKEIIQEFAWNDF